MEKTKGSNSVVCPWTFRDGENYVISLEVTESPKTLEIRIANKITAEEWTCQYDFKYIEELTQRTGNYKSFDVFTAMIKSALLKSTDSVELNLMTYDDLKSLKSKRLKNGGKLEFSSPSNLVLPNFAERGSELNGNSVTSLSLLKRKYLIVKYVAEFDSVHYPLALTHAGAPDPTIMQNNIKKLMGEVTFLRNTNQALAEKLKNVGAEMHLQNGWEFQTFLHGSEANLQVSSLLEAIESLERKSATERMEHFKEMETLQSENTKLRDQIAALQVSDEEMNRQITRLERASAGYVPRRQESAQTILTRQTLDSDRDRPSRSRNRERPNSEIRSRHSSSSFEFRRQFANSIAKATVATGNQTSSGLVLGRIRSRTPSPSQVPKFDPTLYIREKKLRQEQIAQLRMARINSNFGRQDQTDLEGGPSPRNPKFKVPSNTELRILARRERSLSLERLGRNCDRGRSPERRDYDLGTLPRSANVAVQTKTFIPKAKVTKAGTSGRVTNTVQAGRLPRKSGATTFDSKKLSRTEDFEGSLEALQAYIEDTGQQLTAYKKFGGTKK